MESDSKTILPRTRATPQAAMEGLGMDKSRRRLGSVKNSDANSLWETNEAEYLSVSNCNREFPFSKLKMIIDID